MLGLLLLIVMYSLFLLCVVRVTNICGLLWCGVFALSLFCIRFVNSCIIWLGLVIIVGNVLVLSLT